MTDLKRIQLFIVINGFKAVALVNSEATRNVISSGFVAKHGVKTVRKRLASDLYGFDGKRVKGTVDQEVTIQVKIMDREVSVTFDVMNCARDALLKYPWLRDHNPIVN